MADTDTYIQTISTVGATLILIAVVVVAVGFLYPFVSSTIGGSLATEPTTDSWIDVAGNDRPEGLDVAATRELAANLSGDGSHIQTQDPNLTANWTVCSTAALRTGANQQSHRDLLAIDNESITLRFTDGNWTTRHITETSETAASAPASSPTDQTAVCGRWNNQTRTLDLIVDGSVTASSSEGTEDIGRRVSVAWNGTIDETRAWNESLATTTLNEYSTDPIAAFPDTDRELRVMYDEDLGGETRAHYVDGRATFAGSVTLVAGVQRPGIQEGTDWEARSSSGTFEIRAIDGEYLDGAPIVFISWSGNAFGGLVSTLTSIGTGALTLLVIAVFALVARVALDEFEEGL